MSRRNVCVGTETFSRERFSVLPQTKTKFCQTDASYLQSKSVEVNTDVDPFFGVWKRRRVRGTYPFVSAAVQETQTEYVPQVDASTQDRLCCESPLETHKETDELLTTTETKQINVDKLTPSVTSSPTPTV